MKIWLYWIWGFGGVIGAASLLAGTSQAARKILGGSAHTFWGDLRWSGIELIAYILLGISSFSLIGAWAVLWFEHIPDARLEHGIWFGGIIGLFFAFRFSTKQAYTRAVEWFDWYIRTFRTQTPTSVSLSALKSRKRPKPHHPKATSNTSGNTRLAGLLFLGMVGAITGSALMWEYVNPGLSYTFLGTGLGFLIGGAFGALTAEFIVQGLLIGLFPGSLFGLLIEMPEHDSLLSAVVVSLFWGPVFGGIAGGMAGLLMWLSRLPAPLTSAIMTPMLILVTQRRVLCATCLRRTDPHAARYEAGQRFCEHCRQAVDQTTAPTKLVVTFGAVTMPSDPTMLSLSNPDVEQRQQPMEVAEAHIAPATCDLRLLERFLTFLLGYPPEHGYAAVRIVFYGSPDDLGENLKNVLYNTFQQIEKHPF